MYTEGMSRKKVHEKMKGWFSRLAVKLVVILCLVAFAVGAGYYTVRAVRRYLQEQRYQAKSAMVERELVQCAELCTLKGNYADLVNIKKRAFMGLARSYSIVKFKGQLRAGIKDFSQILVTISPDGNSVVVALPSCELLSNEITGFAVFDDFQNVFIPIETQEVLSEIEKARDEAGLDFIRQGFLQEANTHAITVFQSFFAAMGFRNVSVYVN